MSALYIEISEASASTLLSLRAVYAIDSSGSTAGAILRDEISSASSLCIPRQRLISWNTNAWEVRSYDEIRSSGTTVPTSVVPHLADASCLVMYTDGQIEETEMERFRAQMVALPPFPVIAVLTLQSSLHHPTTTLRDIRAQVDMSVPDGLLSMASHVLVLLQAGTEHRVLLAAGAFSPFASFAALTEETQLSALPHFDTDRLADPALRFSVIPPGCILLQPLLGATVTCLPTRALSMEALYSRMDLATPELLDALCTRALLPRFDIARLHTALEARLRALSMNPARDALRRALAAAAVDPLRRDEHRALLYELQSLGRGSLGEDKAASESASRLRSALHRCLTALAAYTADRSSFVLGSNRANRASRISPDLFDDRNALGAAPCVTFECPILLQEDVPCILLTAAHSTDGAVYSPAHCTSDVAMEAPFDFGQRLHSAVTRGLVGFGFASEGVARNPYTNAKIVGYVPFSHDPVIIMRYMARSFGDSRELWHFVRAYIGMMAEHLIKDAWAEHDTVVAHVSALLDSYHCTLDLKGDSFGATRHPLRACLAHVTTNYSECLRERIPQDVRQIVRIVDVFMPGHLYERSRILAMADFMSHFADLLDKHKKNAQLLSEVCVLDETYQHHVAPRTDVRSLIARVFWYTRDFRYRGMKLQRAVDTALSCPRFGGLLRAAFVGTPYATDDAALQVALPEPDLSDPHFGEERFGNWSREGRPATQCVYCGYDAAAGGACTADATSDLAAHLKTAYGSHGYSGERCVLDAIGRLGIAAEEVALFLDAKKQLYDKYGEQASFLHTQRCKDRLLHLIRKFKLCWSTVL